MIETMHHQNDDKIGHKGLCQVDVKNLGKKYMVENLVLITHNGEMSPVNMNRPVTGQFGQSNTTVVVTYAVVNIATIAK